jgi:serine/threonine protein phosphatase PrpC
VDLAKQAGGGDNVTVIVLRHATKPTGAFARIGKWFKNSA